MKIMLCEPQENYSHYFTNQRHETGFSEHVRQEKCTILTTIFHFRTVMMDFINRCMMPQKHTWIGLQNVKTTLFANVEEKRNQSS